MFQSHFCYGWETVALYSSGILRHLLSWRWGSPFTSYTYRSGFFRAGRPGVSRRPARWFLYFTQRKKQKMKTFFLNSPSLSTTVSSTNYFAMVQGLRFGAPTSGTTFTYFRALMLTFPMVVCDIMTFALLLHFLLPFFSNLIDSDFTFYFALASLSLFQIIFRRTETFVALGLLFVLARLIPVVGAVGCPRCGGAVGAACLGDPTKCPMFTDVRTNANI